MNTRTKNPLNRIRKHRHDLIFAGLFVSATRSLPVEVFSGVPQADGRCTFSFTTREEYLDLRRQLATAINGVVATIRHESQRLKSPVLALAARGFSDASKANLGTMAYVLNLLIAQAKRQAQQQWLAAHPEYHIPTPRPFKARQRKVRPVWGWNAVVGVYATIAPGERIRKVIEPIVPGGRIEIKVDETSFIPRESHVGNIDEGAIPSESGHQEPFVSAK